MATKESELPAGGASQAPDNETLLDWYRTMVTSRRLDDREISLKRQNKIFFQISGAGHEAVQVALADHLRPGSDWFYLYYRDRALSLALGQSPLDHLLQAVAAEADPSSGGRQMPSHFGDPRFNIVSTSSPTGTQFIQSVGTAEAGYRAARIPALRDKVTTFAEDEIVLCCSGDGTTSEGEFWEAMNTACNLELPVLFLIEDNEYAISVPVEVQTAGGSVSKLLTGFPGLKIIECDGTDVLDSHRAAGEAVAWCRSRQGPALLHAHTTRPYSHSMSDDERMYRPESERAAQDAKDPLTLTRALLLERGAATGEELDRLEADIEASVSAAADQALAHPQPPTSTATSGCSPSPSTPRDRPSIQRTIPSSRTRRNSPWWTFSTGACETKWPGIHGSSSSARTSPTSSRDDHIRRRQRKGRRVQGDPQPAAPSSDRDRVFNSAARRGDDRRPRHRHGRPAGLKPVVEDAVLRLRLARLHAAAQRAGDHPLALER